MLNALSHLILTLTLGCWKATKIIVNGKTKDKLIKESLISDAKKSRK